MTSDLDLPADIRNRKNMHVVRCAYQKNCVLKPRPNGQPTITFRICQDLQPARL